MEGEGNTGSAAAPGVAMVIPPQQQQQQPVVGGVGGSDGFRDLDCNDNTCCGHQTLSTSPNQVPLAEAAPHTAASSPGRSSSRASTSSEHLPAAAPTTTPGLLYSPEDTLNNDFFYDDEFTVPFDANLAHNETEAAVADVAVDIDSLLLLSRMNEVNNAKWNIGRMVQSKSDSCLYQPDTLDMSAESDVCNFSGSEHECFSSSEMSDFKSELLFTPPPNEEEQQRHLHGSRAGSVELSGSLVRDEGRYQYDWTANKDRYMISYDRSPSKFSTEDSYHEHCANTMGHTASGAAGAMTTWAQKSSGSQGSPWSSGGSKRPHPSACSSSQCSSGNMLSSGYSASGSNNDAKSGSEYGYSCDSGASHTMSAGSAATSAMESSSSSHKLKKGLFHSSSSDTSTSSTMTTWKQLRQRQKGKVTSVPEGMTTWQKLREARNEARLENSCYKRSKSMSDINAGSFTTVSSEDMTIVPELVPEPEQESPKECVRCRPESARRQAADCAPKRYSTSLLELYKRMKAQCDEDFAAGNEAMVSPNSLQFLLETWSISPVNSSATKAVQSQASNASNLANGINSWSTVKNLNAAEAAAAHAGEHLAGNISPTTLFAMAKTDGLIANAGVQAGSMLGVRPPAYLNLVGPLQDIAVQFPPKTKDGCMQTSVARSMSLDRGEVKHKSLQTSISMEELGNPRPSLYKTRSKSSDTVVKLSRRAKERMSRSMLFMKSLPDLSFLNKGMSRSINSLEDLQNQNNITTNKPKITSPVKMRFPQTHVDSKLTNSKDYRPKKPPRQFLKRNSKHPKESSPSIVGRTRIRSSDSGSNNSFCSSSSSGIDSGDLHHTRSESTQHIRSSTDSGHYSSHHSLDDAPHASPTKSIPSHMKHTEKSHQVPKPNDRSDGVCSVCRKQMDGCGMMESGCELARQRMISSHPSCNIGIECHHSPQHHSRRGPGQGHGQGQGHCCQDKHVQRCMAFPCQHCDCAPMQMEVVHQVLRCGCEVPVQVPVQNCYRNACSGRGSSPCGGCGSRVSPLTAKLTSPKRPLKSCLVKKRKDRRLLTMKHRSWSDPTDATLLKYDEESKMKYQLITHSRDCARHHLSNGLDNQKSPEKTTDALQFDKVEVMSVEVSKKLTRGHLELPMCCRPTHPPPGKGHVKESSSPTTAITATPPNSPEQNTDSGCTCTGPTPSAPPPIEAAPSSAPMHDSNDSNAEVPPSNFLPESETSSFETSRTKKSVSFSEEISYHSPRNSPRHSPRKHVSLLTESLDGASPVIHRYHPVGLRKKRPVSLPPGLPTVLPEPVHIDIDRESPPHDFLVSPHSASPPPFLDVHPMVDMARKKELVLDVMRGAEAVLQYFSQTRDLEQKMHLGNTSVCPEVGKLVLEHVCPAVFAVMLDGLHPHVHSVFGKVKNSAWKVIEDAAEFNSSSRIITEMVQDLRNLDFLTTAWLRFNAFIFGLLNNKALDFWLTHLHNQRSLLTRHYSTNSFLLLSNSVTKNLFVDMMMALQPLAQMPFRLEYNFEYRILHEKQQLQMAEYLLDKHVSQAAELHAEGQHFVAQQGILEHHHGNISSQKASVVAAAKPVAEKIDDNISMASSLTKQTKDVLVAKGRHLVEKISDNKELLAKLQQNKDSLVSSGVQVLQNMVPWNDLVNVAVGYSGKRMKEGNRAIRMSKSVPQLIGINDSGTGDLMTFGLEDSDAPEVKKVESKVPRSATADAVTDKAVTIVKDNQMMQSDLESSDSDSGDQQEKLLNTVAKRIKFFSGSTSNIEQKAYKTGITEYQFDNKTSPSEKDYLTDQTDDIKKAVESRSCSATATYGLEKKESLFDENGILKSPPDHHPVVFQIPSRDGSQSSPMSCSPTSSASLPTMSSSFSSTSPPRDETKGTKKWSSLGPTIINLFDKLLLDDPPHKPEDSEEVVNQVKQEKACSGSIQNKDSPSRSASTESGTWNTAKRRLAAFTGRAVSMDSGVETEKMNDISNSAGTVEDLSGLVMDGVRRKPSHLSMKHSPEMTDLAQHQVPSPADISPQPSTSCGRSGGAITLPLLPSDSDAESDLTEASSSGDYSMVCGSRVKTLCSYLAMEDGQLSFDKGTLLNVIKEVDSDWLLCYYGNHRGVVHKACTKSY